MSYLLLCLFLGFITLSVALYLGVGLMRPYKKFSHSYAFSDLLDYALLGPYDTLILKNGALLKCFKVYPHSQSYLLEFEYEKLHTRLSQSLKKLDKSFIFNFDVIREQDLNFDDKSEHLYSDKTVGTLISQRKDYFLEHPAYKNAFYLSFTKLDNKLDTDSITSLFKQRIPNDKLKRAVYEFNQEVLSLVEGFKDTARIVPAKGIFDGDKICGHETINFLKQCISGRKCHLNYSELSPLIDDLLSNEDFKTGQCPSLGDSNIGVISIDGLPLSSNLGMLNSLNSLPFEFRFSTRFISYSKVESQVKLALLRRMWVQKRKSLFSMLTGQNDGMVNQDAEEMVENVDEAKKAVAQNQHQFGAYSAKVIVFDHDLESLNSKAQCCLKKFESLGFLGRIETLNATEAYLGSLPGHSVEDLRRAMVSNAVVSDLLPLHDSFHGEEYSPNPNDGNMAPSLMQVVNPSYEICNLNLHIKDLANCLLVGPPGSGKSVFLGATLLSLLKYPGMKIFAFDKGQSFYALTRFLKGNHISLSASSKVRFCPLYDLGSASKIAMGAEFIKKLYTCGKHTLTAADEGIIHDTLTVLAKQPNERHALTDFYNLLPNKELKEVLSRYLYTVNPNCPLDGAKNPDLNAPLSVFECGNFFEESNSFMYPVLNCIFSLINAEILNSKASAIIIDEAWMMLANEQFCTQLLAWIKTVRKHNTLVILATQSINDFARSSMLEDILDCVKTRIYLPNADIKSPSLHSLYARLGLNEKQMDEIFHGVAKQDLFLHKDGTFMPFRLAISQSELKLLSQVAKDQRQVDTLYKKLGQDFVWEL